MKKLTCILFSVFLFHGFLHAQNIISVREHGSFPIVAPAASTIIVVDDGQDSLIYKSVQLFKNDIEAVSGKILAIKSSVSNTQNIILIGDIQKSGLIRQLVINGKLNTKNIYNKWEGYQIQIVHALFPGVRSALIIAGSDRRGTAYGIFELSRQMGVSPWYYWADVPVKKKKELYLKVNTFINDAPSVKYRGIFINDEAPALSNWTKQKFGGFNHLFYEKVFELMLRLKANYIWPAMWGNAFYDDDSVNIKTAEVYGIVIGTSHHEPLMRAHDEWRRYGKGKWNYDSNQVQLKQFWKYGIERATNEKIVTVGMRGDGDEPMTRETATTLLERIVADQRQIIQIVTGKPSSQTPQLWALYKEVQDYYDKGMRVPDDVTLLLCDDNWGNIRRLPNLKDKSRKGGYGIYYHFDYVGGPRNYKWINTNNLARVWEQMHLAYEYKVDKIWIVNVGDIKPMELPISFFLDYAWNPKKWNPNNLNDYYSRWAIEQFGKDPDHKIAMLLRKYAQQSAARKPELLDQVTYSIEHYHEFERIDEEWLQLELEGERIYSRQPSENRDVFYQLVLHPIKAFANLYHLYYAAAMNRAYANKKSIIANKYAEKVKYFFGMDSVITKQYHTIHGGKWNHMMDQTHIGYTNWQQPEQNKIPEVKYVSNKNSDNSLQLKELIANSKKIYVNHIDSKSFYEKDKYVSILASHFTNAINNSGNQWTVIPGIGREGDGITTFPVTANKQIVNKTAAHLEYNVEVYDSGIVKVEAYFSPTLNFQNDEGLLYGISIDDEQPQIISINKETNDPAIWEQWVANNCIIKSSIHNISKPGKHQLKYWMVSPAVILQKIVLDLGGVKQSYLGPPETRKQ